MIAITAESAAIESSPEELSGYFRHRSTRRLNGTDERWTVSGAANSPHPVQTVTVVEAIVFGAAQSGQRFEAHFEQRQPAGARGWRLHLGAPVGGLAGGRRTGAREGGAGADGNSPKVYQTGRRRLRHSLPAPAVHTGAICPPALRW